MDTTEKTEKVCVIGAGIAGLVTAKVLSADGFNVTVLEKESALGGTWNADRTYPGLRANNSKYTYSYSDFPYPKDAAVHPYAEQIRGYLESYANHFEIRQKIRFDTRVVHIERATDPKKLIVDSESPSGKVREEYDFVAVCNGVFHKPNVPEIDGMAQFEGKIVPACHVTQSTYDECRYPIIAGGGKTALDCATWAAKLNLQPQLIMRHPHWMTPRYLLGFIPADFLVVSKLSGSLLRYHRFRRWEKFLHTTGAPFVRVWWSAFSKLFSKLTKMPKKMIPPPLPTELERVGVGAEFFTQLSDNKATVTIGEIGRFHRDHVELLDGTTMPADLVIFATGWKQSIDFIDPTLRDEIVDHSGRFHLYRQILPTTIPNLGFIGYASSFAAQMTAEVGAHWLSQCFLGAIDLPSPQAMEDEINQVHQWAQEVMPSRREGYFVGAYMTNYVEDLLEDMKVPTNRTKNFVSEFLGPCLASRFATLTEERRAVRNHQVPRSKFYFGVKHAAVALAAIVALLAF